MPFYIFYHSSFKIWHVPSKLLVNPPEVKLLVNSLLPRRHVRAHLLPEGWKNPIVTGKLLLRVDFWIETIQWRWFLFIIQTRYCSPSWNPKIPKIHRIVDPEITFPTLGSWNCSRFQNGSTIPERCYWSAARSFGSVFGWSFRRYQFVRHPCQACNHYAQGHSISSTNSWRTRLNHSFKFSLEYQLSGSTFHPYCSSNLFLFN